MKSSKVLLVVLILLAVGLGAYFLGKEKFSTKLNLPPSPNLLPSLTESSPTPTPVPIENWKIYKNERFGYTFKYPPYWVVIDSIPVEKRKQIFVAPPWVADKFKSGGNFGGGDFLNIGIRIDDNFSPAKSDNFHTVSQKITTIDDLPAVEYTINWLISVHGTSKGSVETEVVLEKSGEKYIFSSYKKENKVIFDQMLSTFKFTE